MRQAVVNGDLAIALVEVEARLAVCRGCREFRGMGA